MAKHYKMCGIVRVMSGQVDEKLFYLCAGEVVDDTVALDK